MHLFNEFTTQFRISHPNYLIKHPEATLALICVCNEIVFSKKSKLKTSAFIVGGYFN